MMAITRIELRMRNCLREADTQEEWTGTLQNFMGQRNSPHPIHSSVKVSTGNFSASQWRQAGTCADRYYAKGGWTTKTSPDSEIAARNRAQEVVRKPLNFKARNILLIRAQAGRLSYRTALHSLPWRGAPSRMCLRVLRATVEMHGCRPREVYPRHLNLPSCLSPDKRASRHRQLQSEANCPRDELTCGDSISSRQIKTSRGHTKMRKSIARRRDLRNACGVRLRAPLLRAESLCQREIPMIAGLWKLPCRLIALLSVISVSLLVPE